MIEAYLRNISSSLSLAIKNSTQALGFDAEVYYPLSANIFDEDSEFQYPDVPDWQGKMLIVGLLDYANNIPEVSPELLGESYHMEDVKAYVPSDIPVPPENSKVVAKINNIKYEFVVDKILEDPTKYNGFYILILRPTR